MTISFTSMLDDVLPDLSGCSIPLATNAIRNAVIEFYKKTQIKTANIVPITLIPNVNSYALGVENDLQIIAVKNIYLDSILLAPISGVALDGAYQHMVDSMGSVIGYQLDYGNTIHVYRKPDKTGILNGKVAVAPNTQAVEMDTDLYYLYSEAIAAGAKARLMSIPKKPYSDSATAMMYRQQFSEAMRDAKWRALKGNTLAEMKVQARTRA